MSQKAENINIQIAGWYETFQTDLIVVGQQMGYQGDELHDLLHQFFLDLMEKKIDFSGIVNPKAYLQTAFKRRLIDHYRSNKTRSRYHSLYVVQDEYQPPVQELIEKIQTNSELMKRVRNICINLPATCRTVIFLKYGEGLSNDEIEQKTGLSRRTIYNSLFKAIKILRKEFSDTNGSDFIGFITLLLPLCIGSLLIKG